MPNFIERCLLPLSCLSIECNRYPAALAFPAAASRQWPNETADQERFGKPFKPIRNRWSGDNNA
jgi:hypothetical protein